jgi:hypothetical protein
MDTCAHVHPEMEIHLVGDRTVIVCSECLVVLEHDLPVFVKFAADHFEKQL